MDQFHQAEGAIDILQVEIFFLDLTMVGKRKYWSQQSLMVS